MSTLRMRLRAAGAAAAIGLKDKLAYRINFGGTMLTYALFVFVFSRIWASSLGDSSIAGYNYSMMVWYFIVAEIPLFALGRFFWTLSRDMKSGQVAYQLSRPYDFVAYQFWERIGSALPDLLILMLEGLLIGLLLTGGFPPALAAVGPPDIAAASTGLAGTAAAATGVAAWLRLLFVPLSLLLSGIVNFYLQFALSMTAFWLEENEAFFWIFQKIALVVGTLLPIEFLPEAAQRIVVWTPFPYIAYAPARIMTAFELSGALRLIAGQLLWAVIGLALARLVFRAGSRKIAVNGG
ncbi:MAG: ABC-2 family transporter protein [Spirochaetes bacterium]|nr:ABC-2 family transporter protein [Spirochaetota bacterium]MBU0956103.1 ABC-2 family transporter protein [Spirochaetota bacterium]